MKVCPKCNKEYPDDVKFCSTCGQELKPKEEGARFCPYCGAKLNAGSQFCSSCGKPVEQQPQMAKTAAEAPKTMQKTAAPAVPTVKESEPVPVAAQVDPHRQVSKEGEVLASGAPIPSKTGWCKWGYLLGAIGGIALSKSMFLLILLVYAVEYYMIQFHEGKMRRMKFKFVSPVTSDEIYSRIQPTLSQKYGDKISFDRNGDTLCVKYDSMIYDININDDGTVSLWWRKYLSEAIFSFREGKMYRKIRTGTALIAYELQHQFGVHA